MPVQFLTARQRSTYGRYHGEPNKDQLTRYFHLSDGDRGVIGSKRGDHNRLGFALQLTTARFLGTFLDDPLEVPDIVKRTLTKQLQAQDLSQLHRYSEATQRWEHAAEIKERYGYNDWLNPHVGFRLSRWLYALCWTGTERPGALFDRATMWLLAHKVILPGCATLERFVAHVRERVEQRLWRALTEGITDEQKARLESLLETQPNNSRRSQIDKLRTGPARVSGPALVESIKRLQAVRGMRIALPTTHIPSSRLASMARFAHKAKVTAISRLPPARRLATLAAFVHSLEATAHDDVIEVLDVLLHDFFTKAAKADNKARLRAIKDLDAAGALLLAACAPVMDANVGDRELRGAIFQSVPREELAEAMEQAKSLIRPPNDVYYRELESRYRAVRIYLPTLLQHIQLGASPAGKAVVDGFDWLRLRENQHKPADKPPEELITKAWASHVVHADGSIDRRAYTFCVLDGLRKAIRRRDVFVTPSWRYADPRIGLLEGAEWDAQRPVICRSLDLPVEPAPALAALSDELDSKFRVVAARLPENQDVTLDVVDGKTELSLSQLDRLEDPPSLIALRDAVTERLPRVDLPEILLEIAKRTGFCDAFTHISERSARVKDINVSLCAALLADACNTGPEPLIRDDVEALCRDRLAWVNQNYIRDETLSAANAKLVAAQNSIALAHAWGGGEVASADGLRFVVPVRTVHAGANPKYFGYGRGVTWYNLMSDQCTGLNAITVPGTLRDSLSLLAVVLEQETELHPTQIITDTGAYSDVVFGLFRLLGFRFSPRLADVGETRFWRIDPQADYGPLNAVARQRVNLKRIERHWDDLLRLAGSLKMHHIPATGIMRTLYVSDQPTQLALALADFGRIDKTIHCLDYIDDPGKRRGTLVQINRNEGRHDLARNVFHGKRGELRQRYREGQEDQLGALGLTVNMIVLWNTIYMDAAVTQLRNEGFPVHDEDVARLSPFQRKHINLLGRYSFAVPDEVARGELRPLRPPQNDP
jgi:TnpA family transposase